jgi:hypothetical protein
MAGCATEAGNYSGSHGNDHADTTGIAGDWNSYWGGWASHCAGEKKVKSFFSSICEKSLE